MLFIKTSGAVGDALVRCGERVCDAEWDDAERYATLPGLRDEWIEINPLLVGFGQLTCTPLRPKCAECPLAADASCPSAFKESATPTSEKRRAKKIKLEPDA